MKKIGALTGIMLFIAFVTNAQNASVKNNAPLFYLDSVSVQYKEVKELAPDEIASVSVLKDQQAVTLLGDKAKNGVVFLESKNYSRKKYWNILASISEEFKAAFPAPAKDGEVIYVVKDKGMSDNIASLLYEIDPASIRKVSMIPARKLKKKYGVEGKKGVMIQVKRNALKTVDKS